MTSKNKSSIKGTSSEDDTKEDSDEDCDLLTTDMANTNFLLNSFEFILDRGMNQQNKQLKDLFSQFSTHTQDDLH